MRLFAKLAGVPAQTDPAPLPLLLFFVLSSFLFWLAPLPANAQVRQGPPADASLPGPSYGSSSLGASASLMIYLRDAYGASPVTPPVFKIESLTFNSFNPPPPQPFLGGWAITGLRPGDEYDIEVTVIGYKPAHKLVIIPEGAAGFSTDVFIYLTSVNEKMNSLSPSRVSSLPPKTEKEVQHALKALRKNELSSAHKHLVKALRMAPGDSYLNYVMGMCYLRMNKLPEAKSSLEKSLSADPKRAPALLALGMLRYRQADYAGAIQSLGQAVALDPTEWKADWMLASSYLHQGNFEKARQFAAQAIRVGKAGAAPVRLYLGQALAGLGRRDAAIAALEGFLKSYPHDPAAPRVHQWIRELRSEPAMARRHPATAAEAHPTPAPASAGPGSILTGDLPLPAVELPPRANWAPPDVDSEHPNVVSPRSCSLPQVLRQAARSAQSFVADLQKFSAQEESQSVQVRSNQQLEIPVVRKYEYLVLVDNSRAQYPQITEIQNQIAGPTHPTGSILDVGSPVLALVFHPDFQNDFNWSCQGLGEWDNQPAWVLHFRQRPGQHVSRLLAFEDPSAEVFLPLKGRAWISKSDGHVMHLETDLVSPIRKIDLRRDHFSIDYRAVTFQNHRVTLWLPENVNVYLQYHGHYLHHYHHFSNFRLFWTGASEKISEPKGLPRRPSKN